MISLDPREKKGYRMGRPPKEDYDYVASLDPQEPQGYRLERILRPEPKGRLMFWISVVLLGIVGLPSLLIWAVLQGEKKETRRAQEYYQQKQVQIQEDAKRISEELEGIKEAQRLNRQKREALALALPPDIPEDMIESIHINLNTPCGSLEDFKTRIRQVQSSLGITPRMEPTYSPDPLHEGEPLRYKYLSMEARLWLKWVRPSHKEK